MKWNFLDRVLRWLDPTRVPAPSPTPTPVKLSKRVNNSRTVRRVVENIPATGMTIGIITDGLKDYPAEEHPDAVLYHTKLRARALATLRRPEVQ